MEPKIFIPIVIIALVVVLSLMPYFKRKGFSGLPLQLAVLKTSKLSAKEFRACEKQKFDAAVNKLKSAGRWEAHTEASFELGYFTWMNGEVENDGKKSDGYFGTYLYQESAFQKAMQCWWIHGVVKAETDILISLGDNTKFDQSAVGHRVQSMYQAKSGKSFEGATITEFIDEKTLRLDRKSEFDAEQYGMKITPVNYRHESNGQQFSPWTKAKSSSD